MDDMCRFCCSQKCPRAAIAPSLSAYLFVPSGVAPFAIVVLELSVAACIAAFSLTRAFPPLHAWFYSDDRLRLLRRDHLERSLDDLSLAVKGQNPNRFAYFKPARVVDFVVVIGDVTRFETQQKEIHKLVISKLL